MRYVHTPRSRFISNVAQTKIALVKLFILLQEKPVSPYWKLLCGTFNIAMFVAANIAPLVRNK